MSTTDQELEIGKVYNVSSDRKGNFQMRLTHFGEIWASGVITRGKTIAISEGNVKEEGEEITVRRSWTTFTLAQ